MNIFGNYTLLVAKVDDFCRRVYDQYHENLACRPGCDGCCKHISLFPVEAAALAAAFRELPSPLARRVRKQAKGSGSGGGCPLLLDGLCTLYEARPLICRTHGLPVLVTRGEQRMVDYCPLNFKGISTLPGSAVLDLDRLNESLVSINALFAETCSDGRFHSSDRPSIAEAVLTDIFTFLNPG